MIRTVRPRHLMVAVATVGLVSVHTLVLPTVLDQRRSCERAAAWVANHSPNLPASLRELATFPAAYRDAILAALPAQVRSALWIEHYRQFAASRTLTPQQQAVIAQAISLSGPEYYSANRQYDDTTAAAIAELTKAIQTSFAPEDRRVFYAIGPDRPSGLTKRSFLLRLQAAIRSRLVAQADGLECKCNYEDYTSWEYDCADGSKCAEWTPPCDYKSTGCGVGNKQECTGRCYTPMN
jgi:hypothetical protein